MKCSRRTLTIYMYTGDFVPAWQAFERGGEHIYGTHQSFMAAVARVMDTGITVRLVSLFADSSSSARPADQLEVVGLGASHADVATLLARDMADAQSDLIVAHFPNLELLDAAVASPARVMAVLADSFDTRRRAQLRHPRHVRYVRRLVRVLNDPRVDWVANHCEPATEHLAHLGVDRRKLIAWNAELPTRPSMHPPRERPGAPPYRLAYAGSISRAKGVEDLVRAVALLVTRGVDVELDVGGWGDIDAMKDVARQLRVADRVRFLGHIPNDDIIEMMRDADLVIVPSRPEYPEAMPLTLFEALAARTPIVCSDHPMFVSTFVDGVNASTYRSGDPAALAAAIERTVEDPELYGRLSAEAVDTWTALGRTTDIGDLLHAWATGDDAWLRRHTLAARSAPAERT